MAAPKVLQDLNTVKANDAGQEQHITDSSIHVSSADRTNWNGKTSISLNNTVTSTSTTQAATANAVKSANDNANSRVSKGGDTLTGALVAQSNTQYTTRQVRNIILSTADPTISAMQDGDIWIKYK